MLSPALRRHVGNGTLQNLQKSLLNTLAGHVAGDGTVLTLTCDLVDLIDIDDSTLGQLDIEISGLNQAQEDVLHVLAHVACLGEGGGVGDGEGNLQGLGQGLCQIGLTNTRGTQQKNVGFLNVHLAESLHEVLLGGRSLLLTLLGGLGQNSLIMIVNGHRQSDLGIVLSDDVFVQSLLDLLGLGQSLGVQLPERNRAGGLSRCLIDQLRAGIYAVITDIGACGGGNQKVDLILIASAEGAVVQPGAALVASAVGGIGHGRIPFVWGLVAVRVDLVDQTELQSLLGGEEIVAVGSLLDLLDGTAGILGKNPVEGITGAEDVIGRDLDIRGLTLRTAEGLVDHDLAVRQGDTLALGTCGKQERTHGGSHTDADGGHVTLNEVHGVINGQTCGNRSAGAVDIKVDILIRVLCFQEQELSYHQGGGCIVDLIGQEDDTVTQKAGEDIVGALAMGGLVNDGGNQSIVREIVHEHGAYLAFFKYCMCRSTLLCTAILKQTAAVGVGLTAATWFCGILRDIGLNYSACAGATALALTSSIAAFTRRSSATDSAGIISLTLSASIW